MKHQAFWARPLVLWLTSFILPLAIAPFALIGEFVTAGGDIAEMGKDASSSGSEMDESSLDLFIFLWFAVPVAFATPYLVRYRGGATMLPLLGRGWLAPAMAILSLLVSAVMLLLTAILIAMDFPDPENFPLALWLCAAALYVQALRAAAVRRSMPDEQETLTRVFE